MRTMIATLSGAAALFAAGYALADGPAHKADSKPAMAAQHEMCGAMSDQASAAKGHSAPMKGPEGKPMSKADADKMRKMCGEMNKHHGGMAKPKAGGNPPSGASHAAPKSDAPKAHNHM